MAKKSDSKQGIIKPILNGLADFAGNLFPQVNGAYTAQLSKPDTMWINLRYFMISNLRQLLSQVYVEYGIVQTLIDQPVDDGFRAGFEVKSKQLDADDMEQLQIYIERYRVIESVMQAIKWARLFGGGAILILTDQDPSTPFRLEDIKEDTPLEFRAVDMWELYFTQQNIEGDPTPGAETMDVDNPYYDYYGTKLHHTRAFTFKGKAAPSFIRQRLRGWGMSEMEKLVRSLNQYIKNQDVTFELLDEAKVDVYKINGLNDALFDKGGTTAVTNRIQTANMIKGFLNALVMDTKDDYIQKQINFTGLSDVMVQIRQGIAADLKIPMTKLFGISAAGFSSGEDDIENYNSMIEGEIRSKSKFIVVDVLRICCQKLFGFAPEDLMIEFKPLRILNAKEEEEVKNHQFNRVIAAYESGLATAQNAKEAMNKETLLPVELDETSDGLPPPMQGNELTPKGDSVKPPADTGN